MQVLAIASGPLKALMYLNLDENDIGDDGMRAFASAVAMGSLPNLKQLLLERNKTGDDGLKAFASAITSGFWLSFDQP